MLILTRSEQQAIYIGDNITVTVLSVDRGQVRIGIDAPKDVVIERDNMKGESKLSENRGNR